MSYSTKDPPSPNSFTDSELVVLAQEGESTAFEILYERYCSQIGAYISRLVGNDEIGHELGQETFLRVWEGLPSLRVPSSFVGWLYRIATNIAYDHQRRERRFRWFSWEEYRETEQMEESISIEYEKQIEEAEILKLALASVSPKYRACFVLYVVEGLSHRHISEVLGVKESSVSKYVSRGKEQLRQNYFRLIRKSHLLGEEV